MRVAAALALAALAAAPGAAALAVLDDAGALSVLVEGASPRGYALFVADGPAARVDWTASDGERRALVLNATPRALALAPGAHAFAPRDLLGGLLLLVPDDAGEAGAALALDAPPAEAEATGRAAALAPRLGGWTALVAGAVLLAVCSRKLKSARAPGRREPPGGSDEL